MTPRTTMDSGQSSSSIPRLKVSTLVMSLTSLALHVTSLVDSEWMIARELTPNPSFDLRVNDSFEREFLSRFSVTSLFKMCRLLEPTFIPLEATTEESYALVRDSLLCQDWSFWQNQDYSPDHLDSTNVIPRE
jgi:hypothetical protein